MTSSPRLRVVAIADADSYVKWAATILDSLPEADTRLVLLKTPLVVSAAQERSALSGTSLAGGERVDFTRLSRWLREAEPDVVIVAGRGPTVRLVAREIDTLDPRPVVVTGFPGMSIPAQRGAMVYRRESDLVVVHSRRERRAFMDLSTHLGIPASFGLATLPFAQRRKVTGGTDLVFAAQAIVPRERPERERVAGILRRAALADPTRRVVVKLRSQPERGETETHYERATYPELLRNRPDNLVFSYVPMRTALETAEGLVTVSSTAAIEAMAAGIPVIALDTFGVSKSNLNTVFASSGILGDEHDVIARRFRHPHKLWLRDNYFHRPTDADWWSQVLSLVERRRAGKLRPKLVPAPRGGRLQLAWARKSVLGAEDHTLSGALALALGTPIVSAIMARRQRRPKSGAMTWSDSTSDITVTPAEYHDPIVRPSRVH